MQQKKINVSEYASLAGISIPTVYRRIKAGKLQSEEIDNTLHVIINDEHVKNKGEERENQRLTDDNRWLREQVNELTSQVTQLTQQLDESSKRHDTIVMQLTQQLDRSQLQLEDLRMHRSVWQRIKMVFVAEAGG